jgi:hypothetical protein
MNNPRSEAFSAGPGRATLPSGADLISIDVEHISYKSDGTTAFCTYSRSSGCFFPRNLVSLGGVLVEVRDLGRDGVKNRHAGITKKICSPSSVEMLGKECFCGCESLSMVTFESNSQLSSIAEYAFHYCPSLSSIFIPSSVESLGKYCFYECKSLSTITFESGSQLSSIAESAFQDCSSLSSICCPSSLQTILARYQDLLKLAAAGITEGDRVVGGADSVEDETVNRGNNK